MMPGILLSLAIVPTQPERASSPLGPIKETSSEKQADKNCRHIIIMRVGEIGAGDAYSYSGAMTALFEHVMRPHHLPPTTVSTKSYICIARHASHSVKHFHSRRPTPTNTSTARSLTHTISTKASTSS
ncbi:unnamed protein product, partial [Ectocarpus sp. 6 AP-2014]